MGTLFIIFIWGRQNICWHLIPLSVKNSLSVKILILFLMPLNLFLRDIIQHIGKNLLI